MARDAWQRAVSGDDDDDEGGDTIGSNSTSYSSTPLGRPSNSLVARTRSQSSPRLRILALSPSRPAMSARTGGPVSRKVRVSIVAADGLVKRDVFRLPDPFAIVTVDGEQTNTTSVIKKTLNPYWNDSFDVTVTDSSVIAVQVFDQKKFKKQHQGFLGVINVRVADVLDLELGGKILLTRELKKSNNAEVVHGKLVSWCQR